MKDSWRMEGKCRDTADDPRWLNTSKIQVPRGTRLDHARNIVAAGMCSGCSVIRQCREEVIEQKEWDQVKGGIALAKEPWRAEEQWNEVRVMLGVPVIPTKLDKVKAEGWPKPCSDCGTSIRILPMTSDDYPETLICQNLREQLCYICAKKRGQDRERDNREQGTDPASQTG